MLELKIFVGVQTSATLVMTFLNGKCKVNINKLLVGVLTWIDLFIAMFKVKRLPDSSHSTAQQYSNTLQKKQFLKYTQVHKTATTWWESENAATCIMYKHLQY